MVYSTVSPCICAEIKWSSKLLLIVRWWIFNVSLCEAKYIFVSCLGIMKIYHCQHRLNTVFKVDTKLISTIDAMLYGTAYPIKSCDGVFCAFMPKLQWQLYACQHDLRKHIPHGCFNGIRVLSYYCGITVYMHGIFSDNLRITSNI